MGLRALECTLNAVRVYRRLKTHGATPILMGEDFPGAGIEGPFVVSDTMGNFRLTRKNKNSVVVYGFFESEIENDDVVLVRLYDFLKGSFPGNVCATLDLALGRNKSEKKTVVLPASGFNDEDKKRMSFVGSIVERGGVCYRIANMPDGSGLVFSAPMGSGFYVRSGNRLGVVLYKADAIYMVLFWPTLFWIW